MNSEYDRLGANYETLTARCQQLEDLAVELEHRAMSPTLAEIVEWIGADPDNMVGMWSFWDGEYFETDDTDANRKYWSILLDRQPERADQPQPGIQLITRRPTIRPEVQAAIDLRDWTGDEYEAVGQKLAYTMNGDDREADGWWTDLAPPSEDVRTTSQDEDGRRPLSGYGHGDLPAPYAEGDILYRRASGSDDRLRGHVNPDLPFTVVAACSIGDGDEWSFRVAQAGGQTSDRLQVWYADRSNHETDLNWMRGFQLFSTSDRDGLNLRQAMLYAEWLPPPVPPVCPTCGHPIDDAQEERP